MTNDEILDAPYHFKDAAANSLREYFYTLLLALWYQGEEFSGKRPFGNSGWDWDIYACLVKLEVIKGKLDEDGYLDKFDKVAANKLVPKLIAEAFSYE